MVNLLRKRGILVLLTIILCLSISLAVVYFMYVFNDTRENQLTTGLISIDYKENGEVITLDNTVPVIDEIGLSNTPYEFSVTNTSIVPINLKIQLEIQEETTIHLGAVRYALYINDELKIIDNLGTLEDNSLYIYNNFSAKDTINCKVIFWIDYYYETPGETFSAKLKATGESFDYIFDSLYGKVKKVIETRPNLYTTEDDIIYISGPKDDNNLDTTDDVDFNYVWYSGKLWRITNLYNDGTMKLVTEDLYTSVSIASASIDSDGNSSYPTSWIRTWLNQEFLPTLYNYEKILKTDYQWNATLSSSSTAKLGTTTLVDEPIGLLNSYEYYKNFEKIGTTANDKKASYLNIGYWWWLMNTYNESYIFSVHSDGAMYAHNPNNILGVRPAIVFNKNVEYLSGDGTKENPYTIKKDIETINVNSKPLNARVSGEYIKLENDSNSNRVFRIVNTETINGKLTTKLILDDYIKENNTIVTKKFSNDYTYGDGDTEDYLDYYLNNNYLSTLNTNLLEKGTYYLGTYSTGNYKKTVCSSISSSVSTKECINNNNVVTNTWTGYVGLIRVGEMFSSANGNFVEDTAQTEWIISPASTTTVNIIGNYAGIDTISPTEESYTARPTINLKSNVIIKSGTGTKDDPFIVGL